MLFLRLPRPLTLAPLAIVASLLVLSLIAVRDGEAGSAPLTLTVDSVNSDEAAGGPFLTQCTSAAGDCSLRGAIVRVNANIADSPNTINFNMTNGFTISITKALPAITAPVNINGKTQAGGGPFPPNCFLITGEPCVHLDGNNGGQSGNGLVIQGGGSSVRGLTISRFGGSGITLVSSNNVVAQNYLGTPDGTTDGGNFIGVAVFAGFENNVVGGGNVISGNQAFGVSDSGVGTLIHGNLIGTDETGNASLANGSGIAVGGADGGVIGGEGALRNVISGNTGAGIAFQPVSPPNSATGTRIEGNTIGLRVNGSALLGNGGSGILVTNANDVTIGGATPSSRNVISGNGGSGIHLDQAGGVVGPDVRILNNYIGTDITGTIAMANEAAGVFVDRSSGVVVGAPGQGNVILGNNDPDDGAVFILASQGLATDNIVQGNLIGTDATGLIGLPNQGGVLVKAGNPSSPARDNLIGGDGVGEGNVINVPASAAVRILGAGAVLNAVAGNLIGVGQDGQTDLLGQATGVLIEDAGSNVIGGDSDGSRNIISGFGTGVDIAGSNAVENEVLGNYIGTDAAGLVAIGNINGIVNSARLTRIRENVLSGNERGILSLDSGIIVEDNAIGLASDGSPLPNTDDGVRIQGGGEGGALVEGNEIANNGTQGIHLTTVGTPAVGVHITRNSIHDNGGLGIEFAPGSNNDLAAPTLTAAETGSSISKVTGTLTGEPNAEYTLEFFRNDACDPSGFGEGQTFMGSETLTAGAFGQLPFETLLSGATPLGTIVTATATDEDGNTSEFSNCVEVIEAPATPTPSVTPTPEVTISPTPTATPAAGLLGDADCDDDVDLDDAIAVLNETAGIEPGACELADVDCDGDIDAVDALRILLHLAGLPMDPPQNCRAIAN